MAEKKEEKKEEKKKKVNARGEEIVEAASKRLRYLQSVYGANRGRKYYEEEKAKGKDLYA